MTGSDPTIGHESYGFVERQLALLGEQDPLIVLVNTPGDVAALFGRAAPARIRAPWAPGKWTPAEILAHLALTEWVFGFRTRTILSDPHPVLQPVDQEAWAARSAPEEVGDVAAHLTDFASLRRANLRLWRTLTPEELERSGHHAEAGVDMTLDFLIRLLAGHDLNHLEQLREGLEARE